jgi:hypothetical protein
MTELDKKFIKEFSRKYNVPEETIGKLVKDTNRRVYEDKRFNAYTHWCNENNKEYNESERDKFYKQYDAEQQIKEDFEDE